MLNLDGLKPNDHYHSSTIIKNPNEIFKMRQRSGSLLRDVANPIMFGLGKKISE